jgi:hypothetical protein
VDTPVKAFNRAEFAMGKMKFMGLAMLTFLVFPTLYFCIVIAIALSKSYDWKEMDWNNDGSTTINEIFSAADTGIRPVSWRGTDCQEIYSLKDGATLNLKCGGVEIELKSFDDVVR